MHPALLRFGSRTRRVALCLITLLAVFPATPVRAADAFSGSKSLASAPEKETSATRLTHTAGEPRKLQRVIVDLATSTKEGYAPAVDPGRYRYRIQKAVWSLLAELPKGHYQVVHIGHWAPVVVLDVTATALDRVRASGWVVAVRPPHLYAFHGGFDAIRHVEAHLAHAEGFDGDGWTIAFVDSGVDREHPDLRGRIEAEACFGNDFAFTNAGEGQIEFPSSCRGGDALEAHGPGSAAPCYQDAFWEELQLDVGPALAPWCSHGTGTASLAAGRRGVAPAADIVMAQATTALLTFCFGLCADLVTEETQLLRALEWLFETRHDHSIAALTLSFGHIAELDERGVCRGDSPAIEALIDRFLEHGIVVVASSGNQGLEGTVGWPACLPGVVSVGASTAADGIAPFSNSAASLDLLAPGQDVEVAVPGGRHERADGTSLAAPLVAGAWAVLNQHEARPPARILDLLVDSGQPVLDPRNALVRPRLDVSRALELARAEAPATRLLTHADGTSRSPSISEGARWRIAFESRASDLLPGDRNDTWDVFVQSSVEERPRRISIASDGSEGNGASSDARISRSGNLIAFSSLASNLVPGDENRASDVFVRDLRSATTERISVASDGSEANGSSSLASISATGRFVAYSSTANNLVPGDGNGSRDVFVHDRQTGEVERVSVSSLGDEGLGGSSHPSISADGRMVAFQSYAANLVGSDANLSSDIFVHDRATRQTERVSIAAEADAGDVDGDSYRPRISADGNFVAFTSRATNLVPGDRNGVEDVFVHDRRSRNIERVSVASNGQEGDGDSEAPSISADGRYIAFASRASNLTPDDRNDTWDVLLHDRRLGITTRMSSNAEDGASGNSSSHGPHISDDGRWTAFHADANDLNPADRNRWADVFVRRTCSNGC